MWGTWQRRELTQQMQGLLNLFAFVLVPRGATQCIDDMHYTKCIAFELDIIAPEFHSRSYRICLWKFRAYRWKYLRGFINSSVCGNPLSWSRTGAFKWECLRSCGSFTAISMSFLQLRSTSFLVHSINLALFPDIYGRWEKIFQIDSFCQISIRSVKMVTITLTSITCNNHFCPC